MSTCRLLLLFLPPIACPNLRRSLARHVLQAALVLRLATRKLVCCIGDTLIDSGERQHSLACANIVRKLRFIPAFIRTSPKRLPIKVRLAHRTIRTIDLQQSDLLSDGRSAFAAAQKAIPEGGFCRYRKKEASG